MVTIGIDSHKSSLSVALVDELGRELAHEEFGNDAGGHRALYGWVVGLAPGERRFGVESTGWIARGLACFLLEQGEQVVDVRGTLTDGSVAGCAGRGRATRGMRLRSPA